MKFGGTSLGDVERIGKVAEIIADFSSRAQVVGVVSAMAGVTDALIQGAQAAERRENEVFQRVREELLSRHQKVVAALEIDRTGHHELMERIETYLDEFHQLCHSISTLEELTPRALDTITAFGERLMVHLLVSALEKIGVNTEAVEATELIVTDENYGAANPIMEETGVQVNAHLAPLLGAGRVPVVTGFIGTTPEGVTTTLGRGGSDYTATILGNLLDASEIWIWTDVDGVMTADPRIVPEAQVLPELSYDEAVELSYFGAKVLYPKSIIPTVEKSIPIRIKNTFNPAGPGTVITRETDDDRAVKAITSIRGLSLVTVEGHGMIGVPGIAAKVFSAVAREGISVLMISQSSSEQSICFVVEREHSHRAQAALEAAFELEIGRHHIERIWTQDGIAIVAVVGSGMKGTPGIAAKTFSAIAHHGINVISIAQGSSEYNLSFVADERDVDDAVRYIHAEYY